MFAIAFDLVVADTEANHPSGRASVAYAEIRDTLVGYGYDWRQGSLYTTNNEDLAVLFSAIIALRALPWFAASVRDIRAFAPVIERVRGADPA